MDGWCKRWVERVTRVGGGLWLGGWLDGGWRGWWMGLWWMVGRVGHWNKHVLGSHGTRAAATATAGKASNTTGRTVIKMRPH